MSQGVPGKGGSGVVRRSVCCRCKVAVTWWPFQGILGKGLRGLRQVGSTTFTKLRGAQPIPVGSGSRTKWIEDRFLEGLLAVPMSAGFQALESSDFICAESCPLEPRVTSSYAATFRDHLCTSLYGSWLFTFPSKILSTQITSLDSCSSFSPWSPFPQHFSSNIQLHLGTSPGTPAHERSLSKAVVKIMVGRFLHIAKKVVSFF